MKTLRITKNLESNLRKKYLNNINTDADLVSLVGVQYDRVVVDVDSSKNDSKTVYEHDGTSWVFIAKVSDVEHELVFTEDRNVYITDKDRKLMKMGDVLPFEDIDDIVAKDPAILNKLFITKKGKIYFYNEDGEYKLVSGGGGSGGTNRLADVNTYAAIATTYLKPDDWDCVVVLNDEGHDGQKTWYVFDGATWAYQGIYFNETLVQEISDRGVRSSVINADTNFTLPFEYIVGRKHLEIYVEDELLIQGVDYVEDTLTTGYASNKIQFKYAIPKEARLIFKRKVATSEGDSRITRITGELWLNYANKMWDGLNDMVASLGFDMLTKTINVDASAGTVNKTVKSGCRIGTKFLYRKTDNTTNKVTVNLPAGESITIDNLTSITLSTEMDFWEIEKVSDTKWVLISGHESVYVTGRYYRRLYDGRLVQGFFANFGTLGSTYTNGSLYSFNDNQFSFSFLVSFKDIYYSISKKFFNSPQTNIIDIVRGTSTEQTTSATSGWIIVVLNNVRITSGRYLVEFEGRWY